ncbi:hypothetical protein O3P69_008676 [Scylla paramamosain]|uniref:VTT domain-containing protein n=1 Tax=Scylla paramamosain TaxID=85552 RepID=A0AAW0SMV0_SCYPA
MRLLPNWCLKKTHSGRRDEGGDEGEVGGVEAEGVFQDETSCPESLRRLRSVFSSSRSTRTHVTNILVTVVGVAVVIVGAYFSRDYVRRVLLWVAGQQAWVVVLVFLALFTLVSMPLMWGYIVVNISAGYMFGTWRGLAVTVTTATAGVFVAHMLIRVCLREIVHRRVVTSRLLRALLSVLGGAQAFKVIAITRLTPIPFGLQNAVFAVSRVPTWLYLVATVLGLLPTQVLNCYLGTTVRSFDDVVSQSSSASATAWGVFAVQVLISVGLTMWVVRRARMELQKTVAAQMSEASSPSHTPTHSPSHQPVAATPPESPPEVITGHLEKVAVKGVRTHDWL